MGQRGNGERERRRRWVGDEWWETKTGDAEKESEKRERGRWLRRDGGSGTRCGMVGRVKDGRGRGERDEGKEGEGEEEDTQTHHCRPAK